MDRIPECIAQSGDKLFWDVDPMTLDPQRHEDFILGRVLSEGTLEMVQRVSMLLDLFTPGEFDPNQATQGGHPAALGGDFSRMHARF